MKKYEKLDDIPDRLQKNVEEFNNYLKIVKKENRPYGISDMVRWAKKFGSPIPIFEKDTAKIIGWWCPK